MIAIVDYGVGNLFSLNSSLEMIGAESVVTADEAVLRSADKILLPGVGAFEDAARKLRDSGLADLIKELAAEGKPLLGICRGIQVLNVAMGGSLYIDLPDAGKLCHSLVMYSRDMCSHDIYVHEYTRLADIMGRGRGQVNSFHHQAIDQLGEKLVVSAVSVDDQVIEAVEIPGEQFVVGVQWHPEELTGREEAAALFASFVEAARK